MKNPDLFNESHEATYCPEDNKLRLYVGRVPRDEYEALRAEGWTSTPKQSCNFVAVWTPYREDTAESYAGVIGDEDQAPADRAADRAERFSGYLGKRLSEASGHADKYESGPSAHGFQNRDRAERAAARHDRHADRALNQWSKAEYWQQRTAGVISHALYKDLPGVRMGRIKTLEAEQRKAQKSADEYAGEFAGWSKVLTLDDPAEASKLAHALANFSHRYDYKHPRPENVSEHIRESGTSLYTLLSQERDPITGHEAARLWLEGMSAPGNPDSYSGRWRAHYVLRLAYENQMLEAQGGRLEQKDVEPGGKLGGRLIIKVSKSSVTGRATSCDVIGPAVEGRAYRLTNIPGTKWAAYKMNLERKDPASYTAPTPESLAELEHVRDEIKAARIATVPKAPPLVNPTREDAERLQAIINADLEKDKRFSSSKEPGTVLEMTQADYQRVSGGTYDKAQTRELADNGEFHWRSSNMYSARSEANRKRLGAVVCKVRLYGYSPERVIILTDKPQKALPITWGAQVQEEAFRLEA